MRALHVVAFVAAVAALRLAASVFLPTAVAFFLAVLLDPVVRRWERWGMSRRTGSLIVMGLFCLCVAGAFWGCYRSVANLGSELPEYGEKLRGSLHRLQRQAATI